MQAKRYRDDLVEIDAFKVDEPGGKWVVLTYYKGVSDSLGQLVKRCPELPKEYPNFVTGEMVPIKWKNWTGESKEYREFHMTEFLVGHTRTY